MRRLSPNGGCDTAPISAAEVGAWVARLDDTPTPQPALRVSAQTHASSRGWIVETCRAAHGRVYVKRHVRPELFDAECRALDLMQQHCGPEERYAVTQRIAIDRCRRLIALRWLKGESVARALRAGVTRNARARAFANATTIAYHTGMWLRLFRTRTHTGAAAALPTHSIVREIRAAAANLIARGLPPFDAGLARELDRHCQELARDSALARPVCVAHRDFTAAHVIYHAGRVVVFDFGRCAVEPWGRDPTQFWLGLEDLHACNPLVSAARVRAVCEAFRDGCGGFDPADPAHRLLGIQIKLEQLGALAGERSRVDWRAFVHARAHVAWLRREVRGQYAQQLGSPCRAPAQGRIVRAG